MCKIESAEKASQSECVKKFRWKEMSGEMCKMESAEKTSLPECVKKFRRKGMNGWRLTILMR